MPSLITGVPKQAQPAVATLVRSIYAQPDHDQADEQYQRVIAQLEERFPAAVDLVDQPPGAAQEGDPPPRRRRPRRTTREWLTAERRHLPLDVITATVRLVQPTTPEVVDVIAA